MSGCTLGTVTLQMIRNYQDPRQRDLRLVYKDLWIRGMTIGTGHPYGVDFTIYEGTSCRVRMHSSDDTSNE